MMRTVFNTIISLVLLLLCCSCSMFNSGSKIVLTEKDSGKIIDAEVGDTITLRLKANPSTGYLWNRKMPDMGVLREKENRYETLDKKQGTVGTNVFKIYSFDVVGPGEAGIKMEYRRPWEHNTAPQASFDIMIRATGSASLIERLDRTETPRVGSKGQIEPRR